MINGNIADLPDDGRKKILEDEHKTALELEKVYLHMSLLSLACLFDAVQDLGRADPLDKDNINKLLDAVPTHVDDFLDTVRNDAVDDVVKVDLLVPPLIEYVNSYE